MPFSKQSSVQTIAQKAIAAEVEALQVDGNDPVALLCCFDRALRKARDNKGATLIEAVTYRLGDHTTADDARRYRSAADLKSAEEVEPMIRLRKWLTQNGLWHDEQEKIEIQECKARIQIEVKAYLETPPQKVDDFFDYVYEHCPDDLIIQKEIARTKAQRLNKS